MTEHNQPQPLSESERREIEAELLKTLAGIRSADLILNALQKGQPQRRIQKLRSTYPG